MAPSNLAIRVTLKPDAVLPARATNGAVGYDLCADLFGAVGTTSEQLKSSEVILAHGQRATIPTGVFLELPLGLEAQVRSRSGLAAKHGVYVLNSPGTIDPDYRGEVKVLLANFGPRPVSIFHGQRIAQLVFAPVVLPDLMLSETLSETPRGDGGFGSTDV